MGLDIRLPIGLMFSLFGVLLIAFGALSDKAIYARSLGININLGWGIVLVLFGGIMLALGRPRPGSGANGSDHHACERHAEQEIDTRSHA